MQKPITAALLTALFTLALPATAQEPIEDYYRLVRPAQATQSEDRVEVLEIFFYGCVHCYGYEPHLLHWLANKPEAAEFRRMPAIYGANMRPLAKAYYTAEKLGVLDNVHQALFDAIHVAEKPIYDDDSIRSFFISRGIDADRFDNVYHSREIATRVRQAEVMTRNYRINGVPAVVVNGKYMTGPSMARGYERLETVLNELIRREASLPR